MKIYIGDKAVKFDKKKYKRLDDGSTITSEVYRYGNYVIKFFKCAQDETFYRYFVDCNLKLDVTSVPHNLVYNKDFEFIGNLSIYNDGIKNYNNYWQLVAMFSKNQLMENLCALKDDLDILSKYCIVVDDLGLHNCIYNNGILYHYDYGNFKKEDKLYYDDNYIDVAKIQNEIEFNKFVFSLLDIIYKKYNIEMPKTLSESHNLFKIIDKTMDESDTVKKFIKRYE